ncbi:MAG: flagellar filament capping protein FliD, partial [Oscillospiraceae bacterium]|nr:flagellar filament capping protein FliD [Oscillospiraceae bacterium]
LGIFTGNTQGNTQASAQANAQLRAMGISVTYSAVDGAAQLTLDENKLRSALDMDPDAVADAFTRTGDDGNVPGIMQSMKTQLDRYAGLTGATKGILVEQAGTPLSSLSLMNNTWQKEIDNISTEIEKWQDKLSAQVDKYTSMFSKLETLIYQMNSQSSSLAGMMGMG